MKTMFVAILSQKPENEGAFVCGIVPSNNAEILKQAMECGFGGLVPIGIGLYENGIFSPWGKQKCFSKSA